MGFWERGHDVPKEPNVCVCQRSTSPGPRANHQRAQISALISVLLLKNSYWWALRPRLQITTSNL
jgi:hypothetical protein